MGLRKVNTDWLSANNAIKMHELMEKHCVACHKLDRVYKEKADRDEWEKIVNRMIKQGAELSEIEKRDIIEYLSSR